jgi:hypothetical protein
MVADRPQRTTGERQTPSTQHPRCVLASRSGAAAFAALGPAAPAERRPIQLAAEGGDTPSCWGQQQIDKARFGSHLSGTTDQKRVGH